jgi:hypothetical protein
MIVPEGVGHPPEGFSQDQPGTGGHKAYGRGCRAWYQPAPKRRTFGAVDDVGQVVMSGVMEVPGSSRLNPVTQSEIVRTLAVKGMYGMVKPHGAPTLAL